MNNKIKSNYTGSENTYDLVKKQISERFGPKEASEYDPYSNCLTWHDWNQAGYYVNNGEKGLRSVVMIEKKENGKVVGRYPKTVWLFAKCQVTEEIERKKPLLINR